MKVVTGAPPNSVQLQPCEVPCPERGKPCDLFSDSKAALREAVARPSGRLSPLEVILEQTDASRVEGASAYLRSRAAEQLRQLDARQAQERTMER